MSLTDAKDLATVLGLVVALITLIKGVFEFTEQGAQTRAEQFVSMRRRFKDDPGFKEICDLLKTDDPKLREIPIGPCSTISFQLCRKWRMEDDFVLDKRRLRS